MLPIFDLLLLSLPATLSVELPYIRCFFSCLVILVLFLRLRDNLDEPSQLGFGLDLQVFHIFSQQFFMVWSSYPKVFVFPLSHISVIEWCIIMMWHEVRKWTFQSCFRFREKFRNKMVHLKWMTSSHEMTSLLIFKTSLNLSPRNSR